MDDVGRVCMWATSAENSADLGRENRKISLAVRSRLSDYRVKSFRLSLTRLLGWTSSFMTEVPAAWSLVDALKQV